VSFEAASSDLINFIDRSEQDGAILVATDGQSHADPAMIAAAFLAGRNGQSTHVFSAVESGDDERMIRHELLTRRVKVETQVALTVGEAAEWPIHVDAGTLGDVSKRIIAETHAQLLVLGQCRHRGLGMAPDRGAATERLLRGTIPAYIAAPTLRGLARRVVIAMDFSETSVRAAQLATRFCAPQANLYFVHVVPSVAISELEERRRHLQRMTTLLNRGTDHRGEAVLLVGSAAPELLGFAGGIQADLIVCGASSLVAYPTRRPLSPAIGRVTRELIRRTSCSLLIAPEMIVTGD